MDVLIDRPLAIMRKRRAAALAVPGADFLMRRVAEDLSDRLATTSRRFPDAAAIHCLTEATAKALTKSGKTDRVLRLEADPVLLDASGGLVAADEALPLEQERLDLAVSLLSLHEVNDLPGMLVQIRRSLKPDGLFLGCLAGAGTLGELRESLLAAETEMTGGANARILPFVDVRDAGALLQRAGFALPVADTDTVTVRYASIFALMQDLRAMGATNPLAGRSRRPARRELFLRAGEIYAERFADSDGRVRATFNIVWLSGWAPHASQQKPARRGSATISLEAALRGGSESPSRK